MCCMAWHGITLPVRSDTFDPNFGSNGGVNRGIEKRKKMKQCGGVGIKQRPACGWEGVCAWVIEVYVSTWIYKRTSMRETRKHEEAGEGRLGRGNANRTDILFEWIWYRRWDHGKIHCLSTTPCRHSPYAEPSLSFSSPLSVGQSIINHNSNRCFLSWPEHKPPFPFAFILSPLPPPLVTPCSGKKHIFTVSSWYFGWLVLDDFHRVRQDVWGWIWSVAVEHAHTHIGIQPYAPQYSPPPKPSAPANHRVLLYNCHIWICRYPRWWLVVTELASGLVGIQSRNHYNVAISMKIGGL